MFTKLLSKLKDKARRELFVAGQIKTGIPFQIRALRDKYGWTQAELGERLGMTQTNISRLESPGYGKLNITTLQRLAAAFDVALVVRFVPFSRLINWVDNLSPEDMAPISFEEELSDLEELAARDTATFARVTFKSGAFTVNPIWATSVETSFAVPHAIKVVPMVFHYEGQRVELKESGVYTNEDLALALSTPPPNVVIDRSDTYPM